jgi:geranylgeranyl diphosphate synthase type II
VTQSTEQLGKTAGKDEAANKATYPALLGLEKSRAEARRLTDQALAALRPFRSHGARLEEIARYLLDREY